MQTQGEFLVGISFNPSNNEHVNHVKRTVADLIDYINEHGKNNRCTAICVHQLEDAAMWGVKSITKPVIE
jgi:hypothetical protein